ncbi:hypothetical protein RND71_010636 [Anisodus tanguticus]|uniref:Uncharacterized protein n=1 Tax=Anisodus tanguticus TaxID=243964 RepID=A0AAE1SK61_9SOLA|nr:hypothetical protein RND71_010636 [Anisodus tanguticus]
MLGYVPRLESISVRTSGIHVAVLGDMLYLITMSVVKQVQPLFIRLPSFSPSGKDSLPDCDLLFSTSLGIAGLERALGNVFEEEEWGPVKWCVLAKHFERQGKSPYAYHAQYCTPRFSWTARWKWLAKAQ